MTVTQFLIAAEFPKPWITHGLATGRFFERQADAFHEEYGEAKPSGGTEHWRYGSFLHWLRQSLTEIRLHQLLEAALADPDPPMAGNVLKALVARPNVTDEMLRVAKDAVEKNPNYYVHASELELLHSQSKGHGANAA